jgi:hypothetical protein
MVFHSRAGNKFHIAPTTSSAGSSAKPVSHGKAFRLKHFSMAAAENLTN